MKSRHLVPAVLAGMTPVFYPLFAQEAGGISATLGVNQRFESADNLGLEIPSEGQTNLSTTRLDFNLKSETKSQNLNLSAGGVIRLGRVPSGNTDADGFADPRIALNYGRNSSNASFGVNASFRQSDISFTRPLTDFLDANGVPVLPVDFDDLNGSGRRNRYNLSTNLELGRNNAVGFLFDAGISALEYDANTTATLTDNRRSSFGATTILRFSSVTTGRVGVSYDRFEADDAVDTDRQTTAVNAGVINVLERGLTIDSSVGFTEIDTDRNTTDESESGVIANLNLSQALTDGRAFADLDFSRDQTGGRVTIMVGRDLDLPTGSFSASVGATSNDGDSPDFVGSLRWIKELESRSVNLRFERDVSTNNDDEDRIATSVGAGYSQAINSISRLGLDLNYAMSDQTATASKVTRSSVSATYSRSLTKDWTMQTGVSYRTRDSSTVGSSDSTSIFVGFNREFDLIGR